MQKKKKKEKKKMLLLFSLYKPWAKGRLKLRQILAFLARRPGLYFNWSNSYSTAIRNLGFELIFFEIRLRWPLPSRIYVLKGRGRNSRKVSPLFPPNTKPRTLDMFMRYYSVCCILHNYSYEV
ncbi:hypothetical protein ACN38_g3939 [Penicillium nordicum]|uniref:Uncharacterized protein n=1 Tax=Penicillium nordicum TaxID=229535 RepID=A0A0M8P7K8_9EURO|nr:hypothetical protein ACN38_g3939 [Penicillium nordicum]